MECVAWGCARESVPWVAHGVDSMAWVAHVVNSVAWAAHGVGSLAWVAHVVALRAWRGLRTSWALMGIAEEESVGLGFAHVR